MDPTLHVSAEPVWTLVDLALGLGLLLSMVVGAWRGLVTEVLSLMGWGVSYFAAQWFGPQLGLQMPVGEPASRLNALAGMMATFVLAWLAWALLSWALREVIKASGLSGTDRLLGAGFGLIRGLLVALVVYTLASMTPLTRWEPWVASRTVPWMHVLLEGLKPMLPDSVSQYVSETV